MDYAESKEAADENGTATSANKSATHPQSEHLSESVSPQPWPHTAIERQIAAASTLGVGTQSHNAAHSHDRRKKTDRRKTHRFGLGSFLALLWLVAVGFISIYTDFGRTLQKAVSDAPQIAKKISVNNPSATTSVPPPTTQTAAADQPGSSIQPAASSTQTAAPNTAAAKSSEAATTTTEAISIPIADISLRNRPELVEQLVQVYRSQLVVNPNDTATRTALERLQERSLSDIQSLIAQGYVATADRSLETVLRLFPELTDNVRYKYLVARTEYMRRQAKEEPTTKPENTTSVAATTPSATTIITPQSVSTTPVVSSAIKVSSPPMVSPKKNSEGVSSSKPEIRSVSIVPGKMTDGHFVPGDGGNVFMVELSYSNFAKAFVEKNEATLVTLLGVPEDSMVLAEVPITISADRGTKSFAIETNNVQGYAGGKFQLNFMLNDEFLTSRTLRLSRPY